MSKTLEKIIYDIKEELKINSDDLSFDFPDAWLAEKIKDKRNLLIRQRYKEARKKLPYDAYQKLCITLNLVDMNPDVCIGQIVKSVETLPDLLDVGGRYKIHIKKQGNSFPLTLNHVSLDRLPYTGFNRLIKNQLYVSIDHENYLFLKGDNEFFKLIDAIEVMAVLEDPEEAENYTCEDGTTCDLYTDPYPIPGDMVAELEALIVNDLLPKLQIPEDQANNADETNR